MVDFVRQKPLGQVPMTMPMTMAQAKEWMEKFLPRFKEGGVWGIPRAGSIYRIEGSRKTVVRVEGEGDKATEEVLAAIGWTIEEKENE